MTSEYSVFTGLMSLSFISHLWLNSWIINTLRNKLQIKTVITVTIAQWIVTAWVTLLQKWLVFIGLCRFINARRRVLQPTAAAAAVDMTALTAGDSPESSAAKRMKKMLQSEARSQYWSSPPPHAESVGYTSHAAAVEETHSLSTTPSSTVGHRFW